MVQLKISIIAAIVLLLIGDWLPLGISESDGEDTKMCVGGYKMSFSCDCNERRCQKARQAWESMRNSDLMPVKNCSKRGSSRADNKLCRCKEGTQKNHEIWGLFYSCNGCIRQIEEDPCMTIESSTPILDKCTATGSKTPQIQWRKDGKVVTSNSDGTVYQTSETGSATLHSGCATESDAGKYVCVAWIDDKYPKTMEINVAAMSILTCGTVRKPFNTALITPIVVGSLFLISGMLIIWKRRRNLCDEEEEIESQSDDRSNNADDNNQSEVMQENVDKNATSSAVTFDSDGNVVYNELKND